jgi:hypothetical protein
VRRLSTLARLAAFLALPLFAACTERIDAGSACPDLCPTENVPVSDTVLDAVVFDTALTGFPLPGVPNYLLLEARQGVDSVDVRAIVRFDSLPRRFFPVGGADSLVISKVDSGFLRLHIDSTTKVATQPITISAYDVDTATAVDTSTVALSRLFRADRLLGSITIRPESLTTDSLRIPISNAAIARHTQDSTRLRIGLRLTSSAPARLRIVSSQSGTTANRARLSFDPSSDTTYSPLVLTPSSATPGEPNLALALQDFTIATVGAKPAPGVDLQIGGFPSQRALLRFNVPARFVDSSTVVRAALLLTQRPVRGGDIQDTVQLQTDIVLADSSIHDLGRIVQLAANGAALGVDSLRIAPADSGARSLSLVNVLRAWRTLPANTQRAIVLRASREGQQVAALRFFSVEAAPALRPRLRISYIPRTEFALP